MGSQPDLPSYAYFPGGPWPHPKRSSQEAPPETTPAPIRDGDWQGSVAYVFGFRLFNEGYYWEAHEVWESLWHAHRRHGPEADILKALIKLSAAGVKVRERQPHGITTHAARAACLFSLVREQVGNPFLGLDLDQCARLAQEVADSPPVDSSAPDVRVARAFDFEIHPR